MTGSRQGRRIAILILSTLVLSCSREPKIDVSKVHSPDEIALSFAEAVRACMVEHGYPDYKAVPNRGAAAGGVLELGTIVSIAEQDATTSAQDPNERYSVGNLAQTSAYAQALQACEDAQVKESETSDTPSKQAASIVGRALTDLRSTADYQVQGAKFFGCLQSHGFSVRQEADEVGLVIEAINTAVIEKPAGTFGTLGFGGATFDKSKLDKARALEQDLQKADGTCASNTIGPLYDAFHAKYGELIRALYGIQPSQVNRIR